MKRFLKIPALSWQGDRMACVPRATDDSGQSAVKSQDALPSGSTGTDRP